VVDIKRLTIVLVLLIFSVSLASAAVTSNIGGTGDLDATLVSQLPDPVEPGNFLEIRFSVQNEGKTENDVVFELIPSFPLSLLPEDNGLRDIGTILGTHQKEDAITLFYKLKVDPKATAGNATIKLRYRRKSGAYIQFEDYTIRVREPQAFLTIDVIETEPEELLPGRIGFIKIGLTNYARFQMRNIWLTLNSSDAFSSFESANEKYIRIIGPSETIYETFKIIVNGDAESKVHKTSITLDYQDDIGTSYVRDVEFGLIINERPKYLMNIEESTVLYEDQTGEVVFSISNTATADINFAILELLPASDGLAYEVISAPKVYVGNLESDDFETIDYKIHVNGVKENAVPFNLVLRYKDNFNNIYEDEHELLFQIYSRRRAGKLGLAKVTGIGGIIFYLMILTLIIVFTIFMVLDWMHNKMPRYKRILWLIVILTPGIGALVYYFFGRKKAEI